MTGVVKLITRGRTWYRLDLHGVVTIDITALGTIFTIVCRAENTQRAATSTCVDSAGVGRVGEAQQWHQYKSKSVEIHKQKKQ